MCSNGLIPLEQSKSSLRDGFQTAWIFRFTNVTSLSKCEICVGALGTIYEVVNIPVLVY